MTSIALEKHDSFATLRTNRPAHFALYVGDLTTDTIRAQHRIMMAVVGVDAFSEPRADWTHTQDTNWREQYGCRLAKVSTIPEKLRALIIPANEFSEGHSQLGFLIAAADLKWPTIWKFEDYFPFKDTKSVPTGHALGAAIEVAAMEALKLVYPNVNFESFCSSAGRSESRVKQLRSAGIPEYAVLPFEDWKARMEKHVLSRSDRVI